MTADKKAVEAFQKELVALGVTEKIPDLTNLGKVFSKADKRLRQMRKALLLRLANLSVPDQRKERLAELGKTWAKFGFAAEWREKEIIATAMQGLQSVWSRDVSVASKQLLAEIYLQMAVRSTNGVHAPLALGYLSFSSENFPGQFVIAILENWHRMEKCGNPNCLAPYFLAKRSTQKYCMRGECTRYALRTKALNYWNRKHGKSHEGGQV